MENKTGPTISVIIPAYNVEDFIAEAIESAVRQIPSVKQIIIVDDGSTDRTPEIIARYSDPRIINCRITNQGPGPARNAGLELAKGEFIMFLDGDDVLKSELSYFFNKAFKENPKLDLFAFSSKDFDNQENNILLVNNNHLRKVTGTFPFGRQVMLDSLKKSAFPPVVWLYIFRRSLIEDKNYLRFKNILHEDESFTPQIFLNANVTVVSGEILVDRRVRASSIMRSEPTKRNVVGYLTTSKWWLEKYFEAKKSKYSDKKVFKRRACSFYAIAVICSKRAKLPSITIMKLVNNFVPGFESKIDLIFLKLPNGFALRLINLHARIRKGCFF